MSICFLLFFFWAFPSGSFNTVCVCLFHKLRGGITGCQFQFNYHIHKSRGSLVELLDSCEFCLCRSTRLFHPWLVVNWPWQTCDKHGKHVTQLGMGHPAGSGTGDHKAVGIIACVEGAGLLWHHLWLVGSSWHRMLPADRLIHFWSQHQPPQTLVSGGESRNVISK